MAFEPELDHVLHWKLSYVTPQVRRLSLAEVGAAVQKAYPGQTIASYGFPAERNLSFAVAIPGRRVFVNPYTGEILGERPLAQDFLGDVRQAQLRLGIRNRADPGKRFMSWAGMVILVLLLSGLYLWWPMKRVAIQRSKRTRRFWFDLHNSVGIFSLVFLLLLTLTGVLIGFEENSGPMMYRLRKSAPAARPPSPRPSAAASRITPDEAVQIARAAIPGATPFLINVPGPRAVYTVRTRFPEDRTPGGRSLVIVDQYTGRVLFAEGSRTAPVGARMAIANRAIHTGEILGIPSKTVMSIASMALAAQALTGVVMWWKRTRRKNQ
jgi:uncharacterized iron-regulated membrane protein